MFDRWRNLNRMSRPGFGRFGRGSSPGSSRGQASPEWVALILLVAVAMATSAAAIASAGSGLADGEGLARQIVKRMACAADLRFAGCIEAAPELVSAYGPALAETVVALTPTIEYEKNTTAVPVDFRTCRRGTCSVGGPEGMVTANSAGEPVTLFTRVLDCREPHPAATAGATGEGEDAIDCSGSRAGKVYLQYWAYFTGSATGEGSIAPGLIRKASSAVGMPTFHWDDFEHFSVRLRASEIDELDRITAHGTDPVRARSRPRADARVSSHKGFAYSAGDPRRLLSDSKADRGAWGPNLGRYGIYGGSHAGYIESRDSFLARKAGKISLARGAKRLARALGATPGGRTTTRFTPAGNIRLVPLENLAPHDSKWSFAVTPPWRKNAWTDGEVTDTG